MSKILLVLNWKMAPEKLKDAEALFAGTRRVGRTFRQGGIVICPPTAFLAAFRGKGDGNTLLGAQDVFFETEGAYTGFVSPYMLKSLGVRYVILGHSERRRLGETDETVAKKTRAALAAGLSPILCIGEHARDEKGSHFAHLEAQLRESLKGVSKTRAKQILIAYEPVWAIGKTYRAALDPEGLHETTIFIRKILTKLFGRAIGMQMKILYGGSVEPQNIQELAHGTGVGGFLIGHASLQADTVRALTRALE